MFCSNCGKEIDDNAAVCPYCGCVNQVGQKGASSVQQSYSQSDGNTIAIVGFVFSFLIAIVGLICSIMGYNKAKNEGAPYKGLALAGIIISIVSMVLSIFLNIIIMALIGSAA